MKAASGQILFLFSVLAAAAGCGGEKTDPGGGESDTRGGEIGSIALSLSSVPSDAACLRVMAVGNRTVNRSFDLVPGTTATFALDRLPIGIVFIDAQVFSLACATVGPAAVPSWVAEAPVPIRVDPVDVATVALTLIRNGRAGVSIDFESAPWISTSRAPVDLAVIGDTPYGAVQIADFPGLISEIGATPGLAEVVHLGDIKNGSSRCDTSYFQFVVDTVNLSRAPFVYTPGDNEWTDCHRANNGAYDPLERLATIRSMFFPVPGLSLGVNKKQVLSQSFFPGFATYVENQLWVEGGAVFALLHVVGSNNSLLPWYTDDTTGTKVDDPVRRVGEEEARTAANLVWLDRAFTTAREQNAAAVVVILQADMWDGTPLNGFDSTVQRLAANTLSLGLPVLLIEGDSHIFKTDNPIAAGDPIHGVATPVPNLTRVVVQGSTTAPLTEWLRLHIDANASPPFSWTRMPRAPGP